MVTISGVVKCIFKKIKNIFAPKKKEEDADSTLPKQKPVEGKPFNSGANFSRPCNSTSGCLTGSKPRYYHPISGNADNSDQKIFNPPSSSRVNSTQRAAISSQVLGVEKKSSYLASFHGINSAPGGSQPLPNSRLTHNGIASGSVSTNLSATENRVNSSQVHQPTKRQGYSNPISSFGNNGTQHIPIRPPAPEPKRIGPSDAEATLKEMVGWSKAHLKELTEWTEFELAHTKIQENCDAKGETQSLDTLAGSTMVRILNPRVSEFGKSIVNVVPVNSKHKLIHFKVGESLSLFPVVDGRGQEICMAIILEVHESNILVSVGNALAVFNYPDHKQPYANIATFSRMLEVLKKMEDVLKHYPSKEKPGEWVGAIELVPILLAPSFPKHKFTFDSLSNYSYFQFKNPLLNKEQKAAVLLALISQQVAVIHGPPGTGKTLTLVETIHQLVKQGKKVLVCSPSHISLDNILKRVSESNVDCLRIGAPEKLTDAKLKEHLLAYHIISYDKLSWDKTCAKMAWLTKKISHCKFPQQRHKLNRKLNKLRRSVADDELKIGHGLIPKAQAVFCTLNSCGGPFLEGHRFDVVIIDEASQALEPDCWLAISHADKVIFAGDHHQLPPVVKSNEMRLEATLFKSLLESNPTVVKMLTEQFRMNEKIMTYSSKCLYHGKLFASPSVKSHCLFGLEGVQNTTITTQPIVFIDTAKSNLGESEFGFSKYNPGEITLVVQHIRKLVDAGVKQSCIDVISPYNAQVIHIRNELAQVYPEVRVRSVDGCQGSEQEAVIISMVRSNHAGQLGFLRDHRRLNVAITRARRQLCIIGNSKTLSSNRYADRSTSSHPGFLVGFIGYLASFKLKV